MRILIVSLLCLCLNKSFAQRVKTIKIEDAVSGKAFSKEHFRLLQDNDTYKDIFQLSSQGLYKISLDNYQENSNLQILFTHTGYKTIRKELDLKNSSVQVFKVFPDSNYLANKPGLFYKSISIREFGEYEPTTPNSLNELPDSIKYKLQDHLKNRLGDSFYSKLHMTYGQVVDIDRLYKVSHNAINYKWTPYSYYLFFGFEDTIKGIGQYNARIILDKQGNVMEEIELPDIKNNASKINIISVEQSKAIALKSGYDSKSNIELSFNSKTDSITWDFSKMTQNQGYRFAFSVLSIDAHSGKVIDIYSGSGVR